MKHISYKTSGTCSSRIDFDIDENNKIHNLVFTGGCNGNLKAIGLLCEGQDADLIAEKLAGNTCVWKPTSCGDQLSKAIKSTK